MACNWRIRHKLMLGMALVTAIMGLLLTGTLKGLASYRATMRTMSSKLEELTEADKVRAAVKVLGDSSSPLQDQAFELLPKIAAARTALTVYQERLEETVATRGDPDQGFQEKELVKALESRFARLEQALEDTKKPMVSGPQDAHRDLLMKGTPVRQAIDELLMTAHDLHNMIYTDLKDRIDLAKGDYRFSLIMLLCTSAFAVLLMAGILRFFYRWVAQPIRDLELGVGRVAKGDFEHRIEIHSGDEIEDLAKAFNDMTGRLREMYGDLAQQVNERSRQLVRSERLAGVGFLAAGVAHEINNPLASIAFCSEALERRLADVFDQRNGGNTTADPQEREIVTKYLKMIQEEAFRCKKITQKLLEFSRGGERRREQTEVAQLVQTVLDMVQHLPSYKGKEVVFQPAEKISAWANGQEIQQVFLNLVVNALESMDEGGRLTIGQRTRNGMVELIFQDTGCGMTSEVLENIFEPFFTRSRTGKGTGLGLSISHRIITQHGGEIEATSQGPGQGSTFVVRLPLEAPAQAQEESPETPDPETEFVKLTSARRARHAA